MKSTFMLKDNMFHWRLCFVVLSLLLYLNPSTVVACGWWIAHDLQQDWFVRFSCGGDNGAFSAHVPLTHTDTDVDMGIDEVIERTQMERLFSGSIWSQTVFAPNEYDSFYRQRQIKGKDLYYKTEKVGHIEKGTFTLYGTQYQWTPCSGDNTRCPEAPAKMQMTQNERVILKTQTCPHYCHLERMAQPFYYLLYRHLFLQEGKALYEAVESDQKLQNIEQGLLQDDYRAAAAAIAIGNDALPIYKRILQRKNTPWKAAVRTLFAIASSRIIDDELTELMRKKLTHASFWKTRAAAADTLGLLKRSSCAIALRNALRDRRAEVRFSAAIALGQIMHSDEQTIKQLLRVMKDADYTVRAACAYALGKIRANTPEVIESLQWRAQNDRKVVIKASLLALMRIQGDD